MRGATWDGVVLHEPLAADSVAAAKVDLWWRQNAGRVRTYLVHRADEATADDLLVEVFILAMRRHTIVPEPPIGWLLLTARHVVANHRRGRRRYLGMVGRFARNQATRQAVEADATGGEHAAKAELDSLLDGLPDNDREVLTLTAWYGLSPAEAAAALGITPNAYGVRLHRARARLESRTRLEDRTRLDGRTAPDGRTPADGRGGAR